MPERNTAKVTDSLPLTLQVVADGITTIRLWLQPPNSPTQRTALELRDALDSRLKQTSALGLSLSRAEVERGSLRSARAAFFVNATFGAPACAEVEPSPPPPALADPPPSMPPHPSPPPSALEETAVVDVTVELFDSFSDGWDSLRLMVRTPRAHLCDARCNA